MPGLQQQFGRGVEDLLAQLLAGTARSTASS
jgi:hypothetical protein